MSQRHKIYIYMYVNIAKYYIHMYVCLSILMLHYQFLSNIVGISIRDFYPARYGVMANRSFIKVRLMHRDGRHCS